MVTSIPLAAMSTDLTIYTYDAFAADWGPAPTIETAFEAQCGCDIEFVGADSSLALLRKVQLEVLQARLTYFGFRYQLDGNGS